MKHPIAIVALAASVFVSGAVAQTTGGIKPAPLDIKGLPTGIITSDTPAGPIASPKIVRATAKKGDRVSVTGRIGGGAVPWVKDRAMFTIVGDELEACTDHGMDGCPQPWDYCCEPKSDIAQCSATIQINDAKGKLIRVGMKGKAGLVELSDVTVTGIVQSVDDKTFVIAAESLFVWPALPAGWAVGHGPDSTKTPAQIRATANVGDEVAVKGRIGGAENPIADGIAQFTLVGSEVEFKAESANPWVYSDAAKETLAAAMCEIRFPDASGEALKVEMDGRRNMTAGAEVVIIGTVAKNDADGLVIHAKKALKH
jgi:hypothetical protein